MSVRLQGGYETCEHWRVVRDLGNGQLSECGFSEWTVTIRPKTASDIELHRDDADKDGWGVTGGINHNEHALELAVHIEAQHELEPDHFVQQCIIELIERSCSERG